MTDRSDPASELRTILGKLPFALQHAYRHSKLSLVADCCRMKREQPYARPLKPTSLSPSEAIPREDSREQGRGSSSAPSQVAAPAPAAFSASSSPTLTSAQAGAAARSQQKNDSDRVAGPQSAPEQECRGAPSPPLSPSQPHPEKSALARSSSPEAPNASVPATPVRVGSFLLEPPPVPPLYDLSNVERWFANRQITFSSNALTGSCKPTHKLRLAPVVILCQEHSIHSEALGKLQQAIEAHLMPCLLLLNSLELHTALGDALSSSRLRLLILEPALRIEELIDHPSTLRLEERELQERSHKWQLWQRITHHLARA